jgi:hypothetical protein
MPHQRALCLGDDEVACMARIEEERVVAPHAAHAGEPGLRPEDLVRGGDQRREIGGPRWPELQR